MPQTVEQLKIENLEKTVEKQEKELDELKKAFTDYIREQQDRVIARDRKEAEDKRKSLLAGISFLGSILLAVVGVLWNYRTVIFNGNSP